MRVHDVELAAIDRLANNGAVGSRCLGRFQPYGFAYIRMCFQCGDGSHYSVAPGDARCPCVCVCVIDVAAGPVRASVHGVVCSGLHVFSFCDACPDQAVCQNVGSLSWSVQVSVVLEESWLACLVFMCVIIDCFYASVALVACRLCGLLETFHRPVFTMESLLQLRLGFDVWRTRFRVGDGE